MGQIPWGLQPLGGIATAAAQCRATCIFLSTLLQILRVKCKQLNEDWQVGSGSKRSDWKRMPSALWLLLYLHECYICQSCLKTVCEGNQCQHSRLGTRGELPAWDGPVNLKSNSNRSKIMGMVTLKTKMTDATHCQACGEGQYDTGSLQQPISRGCSSTNPAHCRNINDNLHGITGATPFHGPDSKLSDTRTTCKWETTEKVSGTTPWQQWNYTGTAHHRMLKEQSNATART